MLLSIWGLFNSVWIIFQSYLWINYFQNVVIKKLKNLKTYDTHFFIEYIQFQLNNKTHLKIILKHSVIKVWITSKVLLISNKIILIYINFINLCWKSKRLKCMCHPKKGFAHWNHMDLITSRISQEITKHGTRFDIFT